MSLDLAAERHATTPPAFPFWSCANCRRRLAQIVGARIVAEYGAFRVTFPLVDGLELTCRYCGHANPFVSRDRLIRD